MSSQVMSSHASHVEQNSLVSDWKRFGIFFREKIFTRFPSGDVAVRPSGHRCRGSLARSSSRAPAS